MRDQAAVAGVEDLKAHGISLSMRDCGGTDKLTGFHAALSNGGVGSNIQAK